MPSMQSPPDTVGQEGWPLSPRDLQIHVGFQQTPKRQGQQTMGRLLPACSAFTNPPNSPPKLNIQLRSQLVIELSLIFQRLHYQKPPSITDANFVQLCPQEDFKM